MQSESLFEDDLRPVYSKIKDVTYRKRVQEAVMIAQKYPQAVVKISSYSKGTATLKNHLRYISRDYELDLEDPTGNLVIDQEEAKEVVKHWASDFEEKNNYRISANIILSAPPGSSRKNVKKAARDFAQKKFADNHDYLFVEHRDTDHPHCHLVVKLRGYDGKKIRFNKKDLFEMRKEFAKSLRDRGIKAEASYRIMRGIIKKAQSLKLLHMRAKGIVPEVDKMAVKEAGEDLKGIKKNRPWEKALAKNVKKVKNEFKELGSNLLKEDDENTKKVGRLLLNYADSMPAMPETRHQAIKRELTERIESRNMKQEMER